MDDDFYIWIDAGNALFSGIGFGTVNISGPMNNLALQVRKIDHIKIQNAKFANTRGGKIHGNRGAEATRPDTQNTGRPNFLLPGQPYFRQYQMSRVASDFVIT